MHPISDSCPDKAENQEINYDFLSTIVEAESDPGEAWTTGDSPGGEGESTFINRMELDGQEISIPTPDPSTYTNPETTDEN